MSAEPTPRARHRLLLLASSVTLLLGIIPAAGGASSAPSTFISHDVSASDAQDEAPIAPITKSTSPVNDGESYGSVGAVNQPVDDGSSDIKELVIDEVASPAFDGQSYGDVGQYETIEGRAFGELDPKDPLNAIIQDIELAPTNDDGMVEYVATFFLVKPIDMSRSSGLMWQYVPNRGGRITLPVQNREQGDIGLSSGWQGDDSGGTAQIPGQDWVHVPTAKNLDGSAITGEILGRIINAEGVESSQIFIHSNPVPYEPRTLDTTEATLTIIESETHDGQTGVTREVPSSQWAWANCTESNPFPGTPDPTQICVDGGFEPNRVYQVVFTAQDPPVLGIGFAAFRDVGSFFKYQAEDDHGTPNPLGDSVSWILSRGSSQSGTMLRQFIHLGFNQDTAGRQVQDGTWPWVASRRIGLNFRFAVPDGVMKLYEPGTEGPLWWSRWPDRARDLPPRGILDRCQRTQTCPKIIETAGASEVWGQRLSVSWVGTDAKADIPLPPNVRRYYIPSTTHGGGNGSFSLDPASPPSCPSVGFGRGVLAANPVPHTETRNAIEFHFRNWLMKDIAPPPSQWPRLRGENPTLVEPTKEAMGFPTIPGLEPNLPSDFIVSFLDYDFGPEFNYSDSTGVRTVVPPVVKQVLPTLVPRVDEDGNELGGVPVVLRDAPLGTYLGWNSVAEGFHQGQICGYQGGMIPFAKTKAERLADGDPRLSLEERYGNHAGWVEAVKQAAANAMAQGFLLPADAESLIQRAEAADEGWPTGSAPIELVIESTSPVNDGESYGSVGPYERLRGYALGELDPSDPANRGIVNLDRAPRNASGNVEYRVDVEIQRPVDPAKANGTMLYEVVNRGNQLIFGYVNRGTPLLYESGFTLVWSGWQGDIPRVRENLIGSFPIATNDGEPLVGISRDEFVDMGTDAWTGTLTYPAATLDPGEATLTVRENERDPRVPVTSWRYVDDQQIEVRPPGAPYDSGAIFEFIYPARDPIVTGIGFAATRDVNSYLRFGGSDGAGNPNPVGPAVVENALAAGISQSGRFLRDFIYQGFNEDLQGRRIFEGAMPIIAGSRKTWVNYEFAQPGRWSKQHEDHLQRGDQFPFAYNTIRDPLTGVTDGVLAECRATATCPKIMHVDGEFEVWGARGSLLVTDGKPNRPKDLPIPDDVRLYMVAGTPHGGSNTIVPETPSFGICQQANTPLGSSAVIRALLLRLDRWVEHGVRPPRTDYGSAKAKTLVTSDREATGFPEIPGVTYNGLFNYLRVTDYTTQPPAEGAEYGVRVPRVDKDGNSLAGIRLPAVQVPVATYTGWNLRAEGHAEGEVCSSAGSFIPLPQTRAERQESGDPRRSIAERYRNHGDYVRQFARAADGLVRDGYLLRVDADAMIAEADGLEVGAQ